MARYFAKKMGLGTSKHPMVTHPSMETKYIAAMVLSGVGDAVGYKQGEWEFCRDGLQIHKEVKKLGGVNAIKVKLPKWPVSDDTVMHLATADALVMEQKGEQREDLFKRLAKKYVDCMGDMNNRGPGLTCMGSAHALRAVLPNKYQIPFNPRGGGCGAAMRAMCIGLRYPHEKDLSDLIAVSVESGRMTHNHPTGYLGSLAAALFTAYSVQKKPLREWGKGLMDTIPNALSHVKEVGIDVKENEESSNYFITQWDEYLVQRNIRDGNTDPVFPDKFDVTDRDAFYQSVSFSGCGGASGHDAPMIAYDAMLGFDGTWPDLCARAMFHGGDSDSTGVIAGCWYGAMHGFNGVNKKNYARLEYFDRLSRLGSELYRMSDAEKL